MHKRKTIQNRKNYIIMLLLWRSVFVSFLSTTTSALKLCNASLFSFWNALSSSLKLVLITLSSHFLPKTVFHLCQFFTCRWDRIIIPFRWYCGNLKKTDYFRAFKTNPQKVGINQISKLTKCKNTPRVV